VLHAAVSPLQGQTNQHLADIRGNCCDTRCASQHVLSFACPAEASVRNRWFRLLLLGVPNPWTSKTITALLTGSMQQAELGIITASMASTCLKFKVSVTAATEAPSRPSQSPVLLLSYDGTAILQERAMLPRTAS
jgi:hypothetical protein